MRVFVIGNGVAGTSCALALRREDPLATITLISKESAYFYSRTALMYAFMDRMGLRDLEPFERSVYDKQYISLLEDTVTQLDVTQKTITLEKGGEKAYDKLVLATGSIPNMVPWKGLEDVATGHDGSSHPVSGVVHLVSLQDLEACESLVSTTQKAVVVGGGLIGIELVECLVHHGVQVTFLIREESFWPAALDAREGELVAAHMREHGVDVRLGESIESVTRDDSGRVQAVSTSKGNTFDCQMLGVCIGVKPNIQLLASLKQGPRTGQGILTDRFLQTSAPDVFACGDCAEICPGVGSPEELEQGAVGFCFNELNWYAAKRQGALVAQNILGRGHAYEPPLFFNSSKFFEIEFTNIGYAQRDARHHPAVVFSLPNRKAILRIVHESAPPKRVLSFNVLGARVDHNRLAQWVEEHRGLDEVIARLKSAQFDVEFGRVPFESVSPVLDKPLLESAHSSQPTGGPA